ncbi:hemerythrin domain-containing protein [Nakamurella endophytica]|uniref:Hemerythrin-like domain-containing protein n=1 Tax=Nakamurella endophytica TaxID=1748367 RepID=A0A917TCN6_9ACTN|nr:hemerythrin domain-containing protein [Nakamurella endophytica]GGM17414.1 hypothetical protein GCM10011594_41870 [Nakamurella endophytica]
MVTDTHRHTRRCWWNHETGRWICHQSQGSAAGQDDAQADTAVVLDRDATPDTEAPLVDVRDMLVVHTALLREFRLAPDAVARVAPGAARRAAAVDRHLGFLCDMLHHHHAGEDELLWPKLRDRVPPAALELLDTVEAQHERIDAVLSEVTAARARWVRDASADPRGELMAALQRLHEVLDEHLAAEERYVLPLAACHVTPAEWHALGDAGVAAMPKSVLPLAFGTFAYEGDPAVLRDMLKTAPALPRLILPRIAPRIYARRALQVHGTRRP